jgi:uncharacterized protein YecE (DUF72 family)
MRTVKIGLCGFTIAIAEYARSFPVVEVQQTFYQPSAEPVMRRWRASTPADLGFTIKAWQLITHTAKSPTYRRLKRPLTPREREEAGAFRESAIVDEGWRVTAQCAQTLGASAILFQCPASFRATPENVSAMREFFRVVERPEGVRFMWEPRGPWPDELIRELCVDLGLVHAVDPFVRPSLTPDPVYWRLHGNKSHYANYSDDELRQIHAWYPASPDVHGYVMFNNIPRVKDVRRFQELNLHRRW